MIGVGVLWVLGSVGQFVELTEFMNGGLMGDVPRLRLWSEVLFWPLWSGLRGLLFGYELFREWVNELVSSRREESRKRQEGDT